MLKHTVVTIASVLILTGGALAFNLVNYGGRTEGVADGSHTIVFAIYKTQTEGTPLWEEIHQGVLITDGRFHVILGGITPIPASVYSGDVWLETKVDGKISLRKALVNASEPLSKTSVIWTEGTQPVASRPLSPPATTDEIADDGVTTAKISPAGGSVGQVLTVMPGPAVDWATGAADSDWVISGNNMYSGVSGNIGIGTTSPNAKIDVVGNGTSWAGGFLFLRNLNNDAGIRIYDDDATGVKHHIYNSNTSNDILRIAPAGDFATGGITISQNGSVGIGTTTPPARLGVVNTSGEPAGYFRIDNSSSSFSALYAETNGDNWAGSFLNSKNGKALIANNVLYLMPRSTAPASPTEGFIYVNSSTHHIYCYFGGTWRQLDN